MNKDAILATVIGFGIGLVITGTVIMGPTLLKSFPSLSLPSFSFPSKNNSPTPISVPTDAPVNPELLTIITPENESIQNEKQITLRGTTAKDSTVVIESENTEDVTVASTNGEFSQQIPLVEGKNTIRVTAYIENIPLTETVIVYYTSESF